MLPGYLDTAELSTLRTIAKILFTGASGVLYFTVPIAGGQNLKGFIGNDSAALNGLVYFLSTTSTIVYSLFLYDKLGFFSLYINTPKKLAFSFLAIFTAASYYTAGNAGAQQLGLNKNVGEVIAVLNYVVRLGLLIDTAEKFPAFMVQFEILVRDAIERKKCAELLRLSAACLSGFFYAASITDAAYVVGELIATSIGLKPNIASGLGNAIGVLAALGIIPIIIMSNYKGIRELSFAAPSSLNVKTDRYTFIAFFLTLIAALGTLGAIFSATGAMFGRMSGSMYLRVAEAVFATVTGSTPGMAIPLRQVGAKIEGCVDTLRLRFFPTIVTSTREPTLTPSAKGGRCIV